MGLFGILVYTDASLFPLQSAGGLGIVTATRDGEVLSENALPYFGTEPCVVLAEMSAMAVALELVPEGSSVEIRSDSLCALWFLHVLGVVVSAEPAKLASMSSTSATRRGRRIERARERYSSVTSRIENEKRARNLLVESRWVKGHGADSLNLLADRLASRGREGTKDLAGRTLKAG
jgi:ribonuclease HI